MNRYYVLTKQGLSIIEAARVDDFPPFTIRFITASGDISFKPGELLWWSPVDSSPPGPFSDFLQVHDPFAGPTPGRRGRQGPHTHQNPYGPHAPGFPREPHRHENRDPRHTPEFHERQGAAQQELERAIKARVPSGWKKAGLAITATYVMSSLRYKLFHQLTNPDSGNEVTDFSDELFAAIDVFHRIHAEVGLTWCRSDVTLDLDTNGRGSMVSLKFKYGLNLETR